MGALVFAVPSEFGGGAPKRGAREPKRLKGEGKTTHTNQEALPPTASKGDQVRKVII